MMGDMHDVAFDQTVGIFPAMAAQAMPTLMLIDDHDLYRAALRAMLENEHVRVLADTRSDASIACAVAERTHPEIILIDIAASDGDTSQLIRQLDEALPDSGVIVLTRSLDDQHIHAAVRAGARGYVMKETPIADLAGACRAVHAGQACMSPQAASRLMEFIRTGRAPHDTSHDMSDRELDVLRLIAQGLDNNQIADELAISAKTVKNHVSSIFVKLHLQNRVQAAVYAVRSGLA